MTSSIHGKGLGTRMEMECVGGKEGNVW